MRRLIFIGIVALSVISFSSISHASVDDTFEIVIVAIDGYAQVDEKGDGTWTYAIEGMRLKTGAKIKTGYDSSVDIVYDPEGLNVVSIDANTQVTISKSSMKLLEGSVLAKFDNLKKGSTFEVKTPTATCGIRGSGLGVDFIQGMTVVRAFEDKVYVQGLDAAGNPVGKEVIIPEGWKTEVAQNKTPEPPAELSENEKKIWDAWVAVITGEGEKDKDEKVKKQEQQMQDQNESIDSEGKDIDQVKAEATKKKEISPSH